MFGHELSQVASNLENMAESPCPVTFQKGVYQNWANISCCLSSLPLFPPTAAAEPVP
jgi:hypothetical protein